MTTESAFTESIPLLPTSTNTTKNSYNNNNSIIDGDGDGDGGAEDNADNNNNNERENKSKSYSLFIAVCFGLNYSIGSGILGLPREFYNSGYVLGSLLLLYLGILTYFTDMYFVDGLMRAEAITALVDRFAGNGAGASATTSITRAQMLKYPARTVQILKQRIRITNNNHDEDGNHADDFDADAVADNAGIIDVDTHYVRSLFKLEKCEYQLSQCIGIFCGNGWRWAYDISYGISSLIGLWSYFALFGMSLTRVIPIPGISDTCNMEYLSENESHDSSVAHGKSNNCRGLYSLYVCVFYVWAVFVTLRDFTEQKWMQVFASGARLFDVLLMVVTAIALMYSHLYYDGDSFDDASSRVITADTITSSSSSTSTSASAGSGLYGDGVSAWKWSGMAYMIAVSAFAYGNQYCVRDVIQPLQKSHKHRQHFLWICVTVVCFIVYVVCGISVSLYFGDKTESPCTLAWKNFLGFRESYDYIPVWAYIIAWFVVLFPAVDIASAFPLNAATLCNTYEVKFFSPETLHSSAKYRIILRISVCTLAAVLALVEWKFEIILAISGALGLLATYGGTCILEHYSRGMFLELSNGDHNSYRTPQTSKWISNYFNLVLCVLTCVAAFIGVFYELIVSHV